MSERDLRSALLLWDSIEQSAILGAPEFVSLSLGLQDKV